MSRPRTLATIAVLACLVVVAAAAAYWFSGSDVRERRTVAERTASALSALSAEGAGFEPSRLVPQDELREITRGMAGLKPSVTVGAITERADRSYADAVLHHSWPIPGQPAWTYDTTVALHKSPDGWRPVWEPSLVAPGLTAQERLLFNKLRPVRGAVLGEGGQRIAWNQDAKRVGIDKSRLAPEKWEESARALADLVNTSGLTIGADAYVGKVRAAGPKAYVEAAVLRVIDPRQKDAADRARAISGVQVQDVTRALGLSSTFLRPILGQVGEATPEIIKGSDGAVVAGDLVGTGGLQKARDAVLRGSAGYVVQAILRGGADARDLIRVSAVDGRDVSTTISVPLQQAAEAVLAGIQPPAAVVAIRPSDGHVLAAASGPGSKGYSTATLGQYAPGSTFKTVSGLGMLRAGVTPSSAVTCSESVSVEGFTFHNYDGYPGEAIGQVPFSKAFAHSCNAAMINAAGRVSQGDLAAAAASLGLTAEPALGIPAALGTVPGTAAGATEHAATMIGQGKVLASPLGMATVAASVAKGAVVRPVLVLGPAPGTPGPSASGADAAGPTAAASGGQDGARAGGPVRPLTAAEQQQLKTLLRAVVTEGGARSALAGVPGPEIYAKTGTATYDKDGAQRYHGWMIAIQGDLAVAVFVEDGVSGAKTAGPLLKDFLTRAQG